MVIVFANNQCMAAEGGTPSVITTDPVPMNGNDRASMILNAHYFFGGGGSTNRSLSVQPQVSNDGVVFVDAGAPITIDEAADTPLQTVRTINAAYPRMRFTLSGQAGAPDAHVCFDHHVNLDHAQVSGMRERSRARAPGGGNGGPGVTRRRSQCDRSGHSKSRCTKAVSLDRGIAPSPCDCATSRRRNPPSRVVDDLGPGMAKDGLEPLHAASARE